MVAMLSERQKRIATMRQFELQYPKYPIDILDRLTNYRYRLFEQERQVEMLATVLASSFDFYEHRLNLSKHGFKLVICQKHNACLPLFTLELDTGMLYEPAAVPDRAPDRRPAKDPESTEEKRKRRTADEQRILISQIILGAQAGMTELENMPERTRQRYLVMREQYLQLKVGRPWAS
jgi:hypothetical protein